MFHKMMYAIAEKDTIKKVPEIYPRIADLFSDLRHTGANDA